MDWTDTIIRKPKQNLSVKGSSKKVFEAINAVVENTRVDSSYVPEVRFSKLPLCGLLLARDKAKRQSKIAFSQDYFTSIGTSVHDTFQLHFPLTPNVKEQVFGNWFCQECKAVTVNLKTTPRHLKCPDCKRRNILRYEEIEVNYRGVKGHVDLILLIDSRYYLIDFKTCSQKAIDDPKYLPYPKNEMQIKSYCYALKYEFNIDIYYWCLVYVSRDSTDLDGMFANNKKRHHYCGGEVNHKMLEVRRKQLDHAVLTKRRIKKYLNNPTIENLRLLDEIRPCHTKQDYEDKDIGMKWSFIREDCPYLHSCTSNLQRKDGSVKLTKAALDLAKL